MGSEFPPFFSLFLYDYIGSLQDYVHALYGLLTGSMRDVTSFFIVFFHVFRLFLSSFQKKEVPDHRVAGTLTDPNFLKLFSS